MLEHLAVHAIEIARAVHPESQCQWVADHGALRCDLGADIESPTAPPKSAGRPSWGMANTLSSAAGLDTLISFETVEPK